MDYKTSTIGGVCSVVTDGSHHSPKSVDDGCYMVSVKDFTEYGFDFSRCRKISEEDYAALKKAGCVPEYEDILVGKDGARYFEDIIVYRQPERPALLSSIAILRCNQDEILPEYLYYLLRTPSFKKDVKENYGSGSAIPRIILKDFKRMPVQYPSLPTQKKIVSVLAAIDAKIQNNIKINDNLQQQAHAIYREWFIDYAPFGGEAPIAWKRGKLKDILSLQKRGTKAGAEPDLPYLPIDTIPMRTFAVTDFRPNEEAQSSLIRFCKDDIVIGAMRVYFHRVILAPCDGITRTTCFTLKPINSAYLAFGLITCDLDSSIDHAQNTSKGSTMPYAVWDGGMGEIEIAIPPTDVAEKFNAIILPMLRQIQNSCFEIRALRDMRDSLLPRLMSGELDVSDIKL